MLQHAGSTSCTLCPAGTYQSASGAVMQANCTLCAVGKFSTGLGQNFERNCTNCGPGRYSNGKIVDYHIANLTVCTGCNALSDASQQGKSSLQAESGNSLMPGTSCLLCPAGTFARGPAASSCLQCPPRTCANAVGSAACAFCPSWDLSCGGAVCTARESGSGLGEEMGRGTESGDETETGDGMEK